MAPPPRVRKGRVDYYQETFVIGARNDHLAVRGKPLIANFKIAR
jgi:hypothetical protein